MRSLINMRQLQINQFPANKSIVIISNQQNDVNQKQKSKKQSLSSHLLKHLLLAGFICPAQQNVSSTSVTSS